MKEAMKKVLLATSLLVATSAWAGGTARIECVLNSPTITLTYSAGADAGQPGLTYVGAISPDQQSIGMLNQSNAWIGYQGGLYQPNGRFDSGLPASRTIKITLPNNPTNTFAYTGWSLYAGHGVLPAIAVQSVQTRRAALDKAKPDLVARGAWNAMYEDDDQMKMAFVQQDMTQGNKYGPVMVIPSLNCIPDNN